MERFSAPVSGAAISGDMLTGVVHVFGTRTLRAGGWIEMGKAAFERILADPATDVRSFFNHNTDMLLGRQGNGTLRVSIEGDEMPFELDLPDTSYAKDLRLLVDRKDIDGMSFGIEPGKVETFQAEDGRPGRRVTELRSLIDISPVSLPAFDGTAVQLHSESFSEPMRGQLVLARHRVASGGTR